MVKLLDPKQLFARTVEGINQLKNFVPHTVRGKLSPNLFLNSLLSLES